MKNRPRTINDRSSATLRLALSIVGLAVFAGAVAAHAAARQDRPSGQTPLIVSLRAESTVGGPEVRLGEIADIQGDDADLTERLRAVEVARAPLPGLTRTLDLNYLKARLRFAQVDLNAVVLDAPSAVRITTASRQITESELFAAVREHILAGRPEDANRVSVQATAAAPRALIVPAGSLELKVRTGPPAELAGTVSANVEAWVDGALARTVSLPVRVAVLSEVLVAARTIGRGQAIGPEDVRLESREVPAGQDPLREPAAALGRQATRNIAPGALILASLVNDPPLVRRGDLVLLKVAGRGIHAVTHGEAREDGKAGQVIRVRSLASSRDVYGQVEAERAVRVPF